MKKNRKLIILTCTIALLVAVTPILASASSSNGGFSLKNVLTSSTSDATNDAEAENSVPKAAGVVGGQPTLDTPYGYPYNDTNGNEVKLVYNGQEQCLVAYEPTTTSPERYRYSWLAHTMVSCVNGQSSMKKTDANTYTVYYQRQKAMRDVPYHYSQSSSFTSTISKAPVKVTANNQVSYVGDPLNALTYTYSCDGENKLYADDKFSGALATTANKDVADEYPITIGTLSAGDNYSISYTGGTYTVKERRAQTLNFKNIVNNSITKTYGDESFTQTVSGNETTVTYSSSDTSVASVNSSTGEVTIKGAGTATITATAAQGKATNPATAGEDEYASATASYTLTVNKAKVTLPTAKDGLIYDGTPQTGVVLPDGAKYTLTNNKATAAGSYTATASLENQANYEWDINTPTSDDQSIPWSIGVQTQTLKFDKSSITKIYGEESFTQTVSGDKTTVSYSSDNTSVASVDSSTGEVTILKVGEATITATAVGDGNYANAEATYTLKVNKADISVTVTAKTGLVYNEAEQEVLDVSGNIPEGAKLQSRISTQENYQDGIVKCKDAGEYKIYYKINGGDNYKDVAEQPVDVTIVQTEARITNTDGNKAYYKTFEDALSNANDGDTITLLSNVVIEATQNIEKSVTIDLGGYNITAKGCRAFAITSGDAVITGKGKITSTDVGTQSQSVIRLGDNIGETRTVSLKIDSDVEIDAPSTYGISVFGTTTTETLNVYGTISESGTANKSEGIAAISTLGTDTGTPATINIYEGAKITSTNNGAVYVPAGTLNVSGGTLTGAMAAVYFKSTNLSITDGTFNVTGSVDDNYGYNGNGYATTGYALIIDSCNYPGGITDISVTGGKFTSAKAFSSEDATAKNNFISGGYFKKEIDSNCIAAGYKLIESDDADYPYTVVTTYTIQTVSKVNQVDNLSVANIVGGGTYGEGESFTLKAPAVDNFDFVGWYYKPVDSEGGYVSTSMTASFTADADATYTAVYKAVNSSVSLTVKKSGEGEASGTVTADSETIDETITMNVGDSIELTATCPSEGTARFICWQSSSGAVLSTDTTYTYTALRTGTVEAVFLNEGAAVVKFNDDSGNVIQFKFIKASDAGDAIKVVAPSKKGQSFIGWIDENKANVSEDAVSQSITAASLATTASDRSVTLTASYAAAEEYTITIHYVDVNGKILKDDDVITKEVGDATQLTVSDTYAGTTTLNFQGYREGNAEGKTTTSETSLITSNTSLVVNPEKGDYEYSAIYGETKQNKKPTITMYAPFKSVTNTNKIGYTMTWALPDGYTLVGAGFEYKLTENATVGRSVSTLTGRSGSHVIYINIGDSVDKQIRTRAFVTYTYKDNEGQDQQETIYLGTVGTATSSNNDWLITTFNGI